MARLIPEKTVELWTAFALLDYLGQDTWVWSPTHYEDQDVWTGDLKKFFMLELKVPEDCRRRIISIDRVQLDRYVDAYRRREHPDVIYVLPDPPWCSAPSAGVGVIKVADPVIRRSFADWSFVIRATALQDLIGGQWTTGSSPTGRVSCSAERKLSRARVTGHSANAHPPAASTFAVSLSKFLLKLRLCTEPVGTAMRGMPLRLRTKTVPSRQGAPGQESRTHIEFVHRDLRFDGSLRWTHESTQADDQEERESPSLLLFVGVPWAEV